MDLTVPVYDHSITAISWGDKGLYAFAIGSEGNLYRYWTNSSNHSDTNWKNLGGSCTSPPVVVAPESGNLSVFVLGRERGAWVKWYDGNRWFPSDADFTYLGGQFNSSLAAVSSGSSHVQLFGRGDDNSYLYGNVSTRDGYHEFNWTSLGGSFTSAPVAIASPTVIYLLGKLANDAFMFTMWITMGTGQWPSWNGNWWDIQGNFSSPISGVVTDSTHMTAFAVDRFGSLYGRYWETWGVFPLWRKIPVGGEGGGSLLPTLPVQGCQLRETNRFEVFAVNKDKVLVQTSGPSWTPWVNHFGPFISTPAVVCSWQNGTNHVDVFGLNADRNMVHQAWNGFKWSPSISSADNLGGSFQTFSAGTSTSLLTRCVYPSAVVTLSMATVY